MTAPNVTQEQARAAAKLAFYRRDFVEFARDQLKVRPKVPVGAPPQALVLNPAQQLMEAAAQEQLKANGWIRQVVLKCRQPGGSTYWSARGSHMSMLNANVNMLTIAQDEQTSSHIFGITKLFYDSLDNDIKPMYRYQSKKELAFENPNDRTRDQYPGLRSRVTFQSARNMHAGTGTTVQFLHISEGAKHPQATVEHISASLVPSVPLAAGTCIVQESTAFTTGDAFHALCDQAMSGKSIWTFVFLLWTLQPDYAVPLSKGERLRYTAEEKSLRKHYKLTDDQLKFRRLKIQEFMMSGGSEPMAETLFSQEYPLAPELAWVSLDSSAFDPGKLFGLRQHIAGPILRADIFPGGRVFANDQGPLMIWKTPLPGELYDIGVDTADGLEDGDWSVAEVISRKTGEQVAEYRAKIGPFDYADVLYSLGQYYQWAQIGVEVNGIGFATNDKLQKLAYPSLYIWRYRGKAVPELSKFSGWKTQPDSKNLMVSLVNNELRHDRLVIHSQVLLNEMRVFCAQATEMGFTYRAAPGYNDDAVMALCIAHIIRLDETFGDDDLAVGPPEGRKLNLAERVRLADPSMRDDFDFGQESTGGVPEMAAALKGWK